MESLLAVPTVSKSTMTKMSSTAGVPPDGGYGWVITAASSIVYGLSGGVFFAQGKSIMLNKKGLIYCNFVN